MGVHDRTIVSKGRDFYDEDVPWQTAGTRPDIYSAHRFLRHGRRCIKDQ